MSATVPRRRRSTAGAELDALAAEAGVHPELVRRLVALGLLDTTGPPRDGASLLARAVRLRRDLGLNYSGALLACDLLDRIGRLERRLRTYEPATGARR